MPSKTLALATCFQFSYLEKELQFTYQAPLHLSKKKTNMSFLKAWLHFPNPWARKKILLWIECLCPPKIHILKR